jgi:hypothetical protein
MRRMPLANSKTKPSDVAESLDVLLNDVPTTRDSAGVDCT